MLGRKYTQKKTLTIHTMYATIVTRKVDLFCTLLYPLGETACECVSNTDHLTGAMVVGVVWHEMRFTGFNCS